MKKKILFIILLGIITLGITGCGETQNKFTVGEESNIQIKDNDVTLTIKKGTLTNAGTVIVITNYRDKSVQYREQFELEIKQNGKWHKINVNLNSSSLLYHFLNPQEKVEYKLSWESACGKLAPGTYRIINDISYEKEKDVYDNFYIAEEFTIE